MKELRCADVGFECSAVIRGEDEQDVMSQAADHAREAHGLTDIDEETGQKIRAQIRDAA
jgi:predicted small metal-binding protein